MSDLMIAAVIGSLKASSVNRLVFDAATALVPDDVKLIEAPVADVPLFCEDIEAAGDPSAVVALKEAVDAADGLIIFTPEYNGSIPAVTKNALDWLSRPFLNGPIAGTPVGIVAASPGGRAGLGVRAHLAESAGTTGAVVHEPTHGIGRIHDAVAEGALTDEATLADLRSWIEGFVDLARQTRAAS